MTSDSHPRVSATTSHSRWASSSTAIASARLTPGSRRTDPEPSAPDPLKKVISFSLWGSDPKYTLGAIANADLAREVYPGWVCRFYVANDVPAETIAQLGHRDNVEIVAAKCDGDWRGLFWRFRCAGDRSVDVMISRDADSRLGYREKAAVEEWLASDRDFHIMRDHARHGAHILGGMWGARNHVLGDIGEWLDRSSRGNFWQADQIFLASEVYPRIAHHCLVHETSSSGGPGSRSYRGTRIIS